MAGSQRSPIPFEVILAVCLFGLLGMTCVVFADGPPDRVGVEFQVDDGPHDVYHDVPKAVMDSDGSFLVVWRSQEPSGDDTSGDSIQARRFTSGGTPQGSIFQVNSYTPNSQWQPDIAKGPDGSAFVVWTSFRSPGSDSAYGILGRQLGPLGLPIGEDIQINTVTTDKQELPNVEAAPNGDFVVVWQSDSSAGSDIDTDSIQGRRYDSEGTPLGDQFQVNDDTVGSQREPDLSFAPDGSFVVVWASYGSSGSDSSSSSVQAQRFDSIGETLGQQFQVNSYTSGTQRRPAVDHRDDGSFLIVWEGRGGAPISSTIQGQRYDNAGMPVGGEQVISAATTHGVWPSVAVNAGGDYVVAWAGGYSGTFNEGVSGQVMSPSGVLLEERFVIDTSSYWAYQTDVAANDRGDFVVVWYSQMYPQTSGYLLVNSTHGQVFSSPFFADGFESGDTNAWSETVP